MAQQRLRDYGDRLDSFKHNLMSLGLHNPGRYAGFDSVMPIGALQFNIGHLGTGIKYKNQSFQVCGPTGILLTEQGVMTMEDGPIGPLSLDTNAGNTSVRYDLLVATHAFNNIPGDNPVEYSIIKGPLFSSIKPLLADPLSQVLLGIFTIPAGAADLSGIYYQQSKCPDSGDGEDARITTPNIFKSYQGFAAQSAENLLPSATFTSPQPGNVWAFKPEGNLLYVLPDTTVYSSTGWKSFSFN